jgi:hypothetical protein
LSRLAGRFLLDGRKGVIFDTFSSAERLSSAKSLRRATGNRDFV